MRARSMQTPISGAAPDRTLHELRNADKTRASHKRPRCVCPAAGSNADYAEHAEHAPAQWPVIRGTDMRLIHHVTKGSGQPPVVFVHGFACGHSDWDAQVAHLSLHHRTVAVDLRGHG